MKIALAAFSSGKPKIKIGIIKSLETIITQVSFYCWLAKNSGITTRLRMLSFLKRGTYD